MAKPKKQYRVTVMQPVYYYLDVMAKDKIEVMQKAESTGGSKFKLLHKGDWQNHEVKELNEWLENLKIFINGFLINLTN